MLYEISWAGKNVQNHGSRQGVKPFVIVDHISAGSMTSMLNTFENPANQASSHFAISREGNIVQYVNLDRAAWTQGITKERYKDAKTPIVQQMNCNPNLYCVSIEHEGYIDKKTGERLGIDGDITDAQFWATCWLHRYIKEEVKRQFGVDITLSPQYVLGHFQIDPQRKPLCPGPKFPWSRLYAELAIAESMTLNDYEERLVYLRGGNAQTASIVQLAFRIDDLVGKLEGEWAAEALRKLDRFTAILERHGFAQEGVTVDVRIKDLYEKWRRQGEYAEEAARKLLIIANDAKNENLM